MPSQGFWLEKGVKAKGGERRRPQNRAMRCTCARGSLQLLACTCLEHSDRIPLLLQPEGSCEVSVLRNGAVGSEGKRGVLVRQGLGLGLPGMRLDAPELSRVQVSPYRFVGFLTCA
eukprot:766883-Hanusia_phi.AAC.4